MCFGDRQGDKSGTEKIRESPGPLSRPSIPPVSGLRQEISSLKEAIMLLGLNSIINIINALHRSKPPTTTVCPRKNSESFWTCTNDVAVGCRSLGKRAEPGATGHVLSGSLSQLRYSADDDEVSEIRLGAKQCYGQNQYPSPPLRTTSLRLNHTASRLFHGQILETPEVVVTAIKEHHNHEFLGPIAQPSNELSSLLACLKIENIGREHFINWAIKAINLEFELLKPALFNYLGYRRRVPLIWIWLKWPVRPFRFL